MNNYLLIGNFKTAYFFVLLLKGAFWGLVLGMLIGIARMLMEFTLPAPRCEDPEYRPTILYKVHYLYFGMISLCCTIVVSTCVSLVTPPIDERCVSLCCYPNTINLSCKLRLNVGFFYSF